MPLRRMPIRALTTASAVALALPCYAADLSWSFQASGSGAALIATENGREQIRIGCRASPAELFVIAPDRASFSSAPRLQLNDHIFELERGEAFEAHAALQQAHVRELRTLNEIAVEGRSLALDNLEPNAGTSLAEACEAALRVVSGEELQWFFSQQNGQAFLGFGAYGSEFFGPSFRCGAQESAIEVNVSVPSNAPRQIRLRAGEVELVAGAQASEDNLNGGEILTATVPSSHPFWIAFMSDPTVELADTSGNWRGFSAPATESNIISFLHACGV